MSATVWGLLFYFFTRWLCDSFRRGERLIIPPVQSYSPCMFIDRWPCRPPWDYFKTETTEEEEEAVIFGLERLLFRRVGGALKTWDCVLWANKGKEITVMWDFYTAHAQKNHNKHFFSCDPNATPHPPPAKLCSDQVSWGKPPPSEEELAGSYEIITWAHMESCDRVVV